MARSPLSIAALVGLSAAGLGVLFVGCDAGGGAGGTATTQAQGVGGGDPAGGGGAGSGAGGEDVTTSSVTVTVGSTTSTASTGSGQNPCGTECGPEEMCDGVHQGLDDDCDGTVDEGCPCNPGQANDCFKGDPSYRQAEGCFPGTMRCSEFGQWGSCDGGAHAWGDEPCQEGSLEGCHAITAVPFQVVNLKSGTGVFSEGADAESWTVECPAGVSPCPAVNGANPADDFQPLQSGEYSVTYTKTVGGQQESCSYPLYVGARGLRVELTWNFGAGTDLDLHMLQPQSPGPIGSDPSGNSNDCGYSNCTLSDFQSNAGPEWFPQSAAPGEPVAWFLDPVDELNSCYFAPRGVGQQWRQYARGCHNPRLDLDNISCSTGVTDVNNASFCAPENINIDFPPSDQWVRVGVIGYSGSANQPTLKIFCDGALKAVLGPEGFNGPVTIPEADIFDFPPSQALWYAADVAFVEDECSSECVVSPIFQDPNAKTPVITTAGSSGPAFPPLPTPGG
ncbi:MAG TPA: hypothetical protein VGE43_08235 [Acidimicrobiales bacterium]